MNDARKEVLSLIRATREMLLPHYGNIKEDNRKSDSPVDAVTDLDRKVEMFLQQELSKLFKDIPFAGEEFGGSRDQERFWLCDPIDGTGHFIHGLPLCTVMLALIEKQQVTFSIVYDFVNDIAYHAERGKGAFANDTRISVSNRALRHSYLVCETHMEKRENWEIFTKLQKDAGVIEPISAGWTLAMVACGKLDGRLTFDPWGYDYDFAPGSLLVEEAGGVVANIGKRTYDYRDGNFIAANPLVFEALTEGSDALFPIAI